MKLSNDNGLKKVSLKIVVCMKQVPDTTEIKIDPATGTLKREGVPSIMNPEDKHALLAALEIKDAEVTALSMGPPQADMILREALALGAEKAILLCDFAFAGSDTAATSYILAKALDKLKPDLIVCGRQAIDGDTAQVGPQIAELLKLPQITYAQEIISISGNGIEVQKETETGHDIIQAKLPCLITCTEDISQHDYPSLQGISKSFEHEIEIWKASDLDVDEKKLGLRGSPTWVSKSYTPTQQRQGNILKGNSKELAKQLARELVSREIVK